MSKREGLANVFFFDVGARLKPRGEENAARIDPPKNRGRWKNCLGGTLMAGTNGWVLDPGESCPCPQT